MEKCTDCGLEVEFGDLEQCNLCGEYFCHDCLEQGYFPEEFGEGALPIPICYDCGEEISIMSEQKKLKESKMNKCRREKFEHWLPRAVSAIPGMHLAGIVLFRVAMYRLPEHLVPTTLLRHERRHCYQQYRDGWRFYFRYVGEFLWGLLKYRSFWSAYWNISYEIDARRAES